MIEVIIRDINVIQDISYALEMFSLYPNEWYLKIKISNRQNYVEFEGFDRSDNQKINSFEIQKNEMPSSVFKIISNFLECELA